MTVALSSRCSMLLEFSWIDWAFIFFKENKKFPISLGKINAPCTVSLKINQIFIRKEYNLHVKHSLSIQTSSSRIKPNHWWIFKLFWVNRKVVHMHFHCRLAFCTGTFSHHHLFTLISPSWNCHEKCKRYQRVWQKSGLEKKL